MFDMSANQHDPETTAFLRCITSIFDVAQRGLSTKPLWMILEFVQMASSSAIALMPEERVSEKAWMRQYYVENMLLLIFIADVDVWKAVPFFDHLCETGFSSERRAVLCADHYSAWLRSRGQESIVSDVIRRVTPHVTHAYFQGKLRAIAAE